MPAKKTSANWYIATTHYLTAGLVVPFVGDIILSFVFRSLNIEGLLQGLITLVVSPLIVYLAVIYSARYVNRMYIVNDPMKIVRLSTIYLAVLSLVFVAVLSLEFFADPIVFMILKGTTVDLIPVLVLRLMTYLINIPVFYIASKKYIVRSS